MVNKIRVPKIKALGDPLKPGRHTRRRQANAPRPSSFAAPPAPKSGPSRLDDEYGLDYQTARLRAHQPPRRTTAKHRPGARAELESRTPSMPRRQTAIASDRHRGIAAPAERNYPAPKNPTRGRQSDAPTRQQLAARRKPVGQPTQADLNSRQAGQLLGRTSSYDKAGKATGRAQRPAARLRDPHADPQHKRPVEAGSRHPELNGRSFAGRFFS